jgi:FolB domain-containing protein
MDVIRIHRLELDCIVGIRPQEREHQQRVRLDIALYADLSEAGRTGRISLTADYDQVAHAVATLLGFRNYHLIEMAAEEVSAMLLGIYPGVQRADVRIEKPGALEGRARAASVEVRRARRDYPISVLSDEAGVTTRVLLETREARLELVSVPPGHGTDAGPGFPALGLAWVIEGEFETDARADDVTGLKTELERQRGRLEPSLPAGIIQTSSDAPSRFRNPGPETACLFRCWKRTL